MKRHALSALLLAAFIIALALGTPLVCGQQAQSHHPAYLGFDRNDYPGDANMKALRKTFAFAGYWLNNPPGATSNSWTGKRSALQNMGYGFLLLFNGREYKHLKASGNAAKVGTEDATIAVAAAQRDGFARNSILFLDQEQGGRMLPEQRAYIHAWLDGVVKAGYRAGIYCSGVPFKESPAVTVITAKDIHDNAGGRDIHFFISNDQCPPSKGCVFPETPPPPSSSGIAYADAWQYAQSPRRPEVTSACRQSYAADNNCYPPGMATSTGSHVDLDSATSADPSQTRAH